jgi:hypothetical protein
MGGAMSAAAHDYTALYYNTAAMTLSPPGFGVGLMGAVDDVHIKLKRRPAGYDLPDLGTTSAAVPSRYRLQDRRDTEDIEDTYGVHLGGTNSFGVERLRVGFLVFVPINRVGLQQTHYPDEREQYFSNQLSFELIGERSQRQVIMAGAAWRLTEWLSLGAGISWMPKATSTNQVYLDNPADQSNFDITLTNDLGSRIAPHAGLTIAPSDSFHVGLAYRGEIYFGLTGRNLVQLRGFHETEGQFPVEQDFEILVNYSPHQFALGTAYEEGDYVVSLDVTSSLWEYYRNNQGERVEGFDNTLAFRLGGEFTMSPTWKIRGGVGYEPSPVPDQTGRTNYVDNDRVILSVGAGHPIQLFDEDLELSWFAQLQHLIPRDTNKHNDGVFPVCAEGTTRLCDEVSDDAKDPVSGEIIGEYAGLQSGNPGFPGFQSYGQIVAMGVDLQWTF